MNCDEKVSMQKIKMIVTDLDHTILNDEKKIDKKTIKEFERMKEKGILTAVATARSSEMAGKYISIIKPDFVLSCDGAIVEDKERTINSKLLSKEQTNRIMQLIRDGNIRKISVVTKNNEYNNFGGNSIPNYFKEGAAKIICEVMTEEKFRDLLWKLKDCAVARYRDELWVRFANKNVSKKNALEFLAEYNHISLDNIMCFGDDMNDCEMIKECGIGVAVSNAVWDVKKIADVIVDNSNNDGVANYIKKYFE